MKSSLYFLIAAAALLYCGAAQAQTFTFGFDGCPGSIKGDPGSAFNFPLTCTLTSEGIAGNEGPRAGPTASR